MANHVNRRTFLSTAAATAGVGLLPGSGLAASISAPATFSISLAQWSLHRSLRNGTLGNLDFAATTRKEFGIEAVEYVNQFFMDKAKDAAYLAEMNKRAGDAGVKQLLIMIDGEGQLGDARLKGRQEAVEKHFKWVEAAKTLGCHAIRVNAGSSGSYDDQLHRAADGLRALTEFGADHDISVIVENHGGLSSNGAWLAAVISKVDHPRCGTLPDFGNFRIQGDEWYDRYQGVTELMPFAKAVSAKSHDFDDNGNEINTDFRRMMKIVLDAGYSGFVGIEYEGGKLDEFSGIRATKALLEKVRDQLA